MTTGRRVRHPPAARAPARRFLYSSLSGAGYKCAWIVSCVARDRVLYGRGGRAARRAVSTCFMASLVQEDSGGTMRRSSSFAQSNVRKNGCACAAAAAAAS